MLLSTAMINMKGLLRLVDRGFLLKLLMLTMLYSLLPIGEIALLFYLRDYLGNYLTLALVVGTGLVGLFFAVPRVSSTLRALKRRIRDGEYPEQQFRSLAGIMIGSLLMVTPGFISDVIGFLFFFPMVGRLVGAIVTRRMKDQLKELYQYVKLYDEA